MLENPGCHTVPLQCRRNRDPHAVQQCGTRKHPLDAARWPSAVYALGVRRPQSATVPSPLDGQPRRDERDGLLWQPVSGLCDDRRQADPQLDEDRGLVFPGTRSRGTHGICDDCRSSSRPGRYGHDPSRQCEQLSRSVSSRGRPVPGRRQQGDSFLDRRRPGRSGLRIRTDRRSLAVPRTAALACPPWPKRARDRN